MASVALGAAGAHHPPLPHADKITGFSHWLGGVLDDVVMGRDGSWMTPFVGEAGELGRRRAAAQVGPAAGPPLELSSEISILQPDGQRHYNSLAVSELRGIFASTVQRGTRAAATACASRLRPAAAARAVTRAPTSHRCDRRQARRTAREF
jgi:hypothetical protein